MQTNLTSTLSCAVFGHNFERPKQSLTNNHLICSSCKTVVPIDAQGNFESYPAQNIEVQQTLRQLFLLRRKIA